MGTFKTPQEKKRLSYLYDRRDEYGENNKSSRKSIRWRKKWVNKTYRQGIKHVLNAPFNKKDTDEIENRIDETRRPRWKKSPHTPLGLLLHKRGKLDVNKIKKLIFRVKHQPSLFKI